MIGIISDIHGNFPALRQVIGELEKAGCNTIYCLGDIGGYYCMINECVNLLIQKQVISLRGNHDEYLLGLSACPRSRSANDCIRYQQSVLTQTSRSWIETLPATLTTESFSAVHGGWHDPIDEYVETFDFVDPCILATGKKIFFSGHTHKQCKVEQGGKIYCNPGSVGQPRDYDSRAAYAILDQGKVSLERVAYNIDEICAQMKEAGFDEYYYRNLQHGCKIGEKLK